MSAAALRGLVLDEEVLKSIVDRAKQWALMIGHLMRPVHDLSCLTHAQYTPMTLFPSLVPASVLKEAGSLQQACNTLMHKVANDHEFLESALKNVIKVDSFTKMLWDIYIQVRREGNPQAISMGMFRNDFMMSVEGDTYGDNGWPARVLLKQIEFNTIAVALHGLSHTVSQLHRYLELHCSHMALYPAPEGLIHQSNPNCIFRYTMKLAGLQHGPETRLTNDRPAVTCARGFVEAWKLYDNASAIIVFVVMAKERNAFDQLWMEKELFELNPDIRVEYTTLSYAHDRTTLGDDRKLYLDGEEVAVLYFRDGYTKSCFPTHKEVDVRLRMERSRAIKCPSIHYQLAGCKKIQQVLAAPRVLERFVQDPDVRERMRRTFVRLLPLDKGEEGDSAFALAMNNPEQFVLKPQREGGGNNRFGEEMRQFLSSIEDSDERSAFILMERIFPWKQRNHLVLETSDWRLTEVVSELGIFGVGLWSQNEELFNEEAGAVLRTKRSDQNEVGLFTGQACRDSVFVVHEKS